MKTTQQNLSLTTLRAQMSENLLTTENACNVKGGVSIGVKSRYKPRQTNGTIRLSGSVGSIGGVNANGSAVEGFL
jgi:hypothetical protein